MARRIFSLVLLLSLILPMGIGLAHAFHHHDRIICSAEGEQHVHKDSSDCDQLHYFLQTSDSIFWTETDFHTDQWTLNNQLIEETPFTVSFYKEDPDRGPPSFNVL